MQPTEASVIMTSPNVVPAQQQQSVSETPQVTVVEQPQPQLIQAPQVSVNVPMAQNNSNVDSVTHSQPPQNSQPSQGTSMSSGIGTQPSSVTTGASVGSVSSVSSGATGGQSSATSSITAAGMGSGSAKSSKSTKRRVQKSSERPKLQVDNVENGTVHCVLENRLKTIKFKFDIGDMNPEEIANNLVSFF